MRHRNLMFLIAGAAFAAASTPSAFAQAVVCCGATYGVAAPLAYPPTPYILNPSDARAPIYVVNQGPVYSGPGIFSVPTYSEGGYAFTPYPYVYAAGYGLGPHPYVRPSFRPYGAPPYGAYFYRPPPSARVIHVPRRRFSYFRPPVRRPIGPPPHMVPREGQPPLPPSRPGKPVEEQWTGIPR